MGNVRTAGHGLEAVDVTEAIAKVEAIQEAFLGLCHQIQDVDGTLDYRPDQVHGNTVSLYFDWEDEVGRTTGGALAISEARWSWIVDIYVPAVDRRGAQKTMTVIMLELRERLRLDPTLGRTVKLMPELRSLGPPRPVSLQGNAILFKQFELSVRREVR